MRKLAPPERRDEVAAEIAACIGGWQYDRGVPTIRLSAFHFFSTPAGVGPGGELPDARWISLAWIEEMRAEKLLFADTLLRGPDYQEAQGTDWTLQTNAGEKVVKRVDRALRFADRAFAVAFPKARRPEDPRDVTILLFRDGRSLSEVAAFDNIIPRHTPIAGQYTPMDRMIYTAVGNDPLPLVVAVLVHEATHHLTY